MSTDDAAIRFETDPLVFEVERPGWKEEREAVALVPKRWRPHFDRAMAEAAQTESRATARASREAAGASQVIPGKVVEIEPTTSTGTFRFEVDDPIWEETEDPAEPDRVIIPVTCSGGADGEEETAILVLRLADGAEGRLRILAGMNRVLALSDVLREEYQELRPDLATALAAAAPPGEPIEVGTDTERVKALYGVLNADPDGLAAVCFSGGGIRSATFNLGVLQGLASLGLLPKFQYLSTVSGGGYIGGWLSGWIHRAGLGAVAPQLAAPRPDPESPEPQPIRHLRQYSNYLTPRLGALSADTWTVVSIVLRNLILNALLIVPILAALLTLPLIALARVPRGVQPPPQTLFLIALAFGTIGLFFMNLLRASAVPLPGVDSPRWTRAFLPLGLIPLLIGTAFLIVAVDGFAPGGDFTFGEVLVRSAAWALGMPLLAYLLSAALQKPLLGRRPASPIGDVLALLATGAVITLIYAGILSRWAPHLVAKGLYLYPILGPALILGPLLLGKTLFIAFSSPAEEYSRSRTSEHGDADREWWARWSAWVLISIVAWTLGSALVYFAPFLIGETKARVAALFAAGGLGAVTSLLGRGGKAKPGEKESAWRGIALGLVAPLFCAVLLVLISAGTQDLLGTIFGPAKEAVAAMAAAEPPLLAAAAAPQPGPVDAQPPATTATTAASSTAATSSTTAPDAGAATAKETPKKKTGLWLTSPADHRPFLGEAWQVLAAVAALFAFGNLMGYFISVNRFSLQGMYRNRLIRAYLGASNTKRRPNLFTGFDERDNLRMHTLRRTNRPFHVINIALNLVGGSDLAWQQRKATSFTATPLHCGAPNLGFRRSQVYGGQNGMSLGTAVATSGAAANPSMGQHSSPAMAFIMTLFNARLGIWLGNPSKLGRHTASRGGPRFSGRVIFDEAMGQTDCNHPYVNLSDGGHFDNLGLYEMVRRRCRFLLICDAGGDPTYAFEDLGNAIRKVRIDLGIPIDFDDRIHVFAKAGAGVAVPAKARYCAIGKISYKAVDGEGAQDGTLIYLKPAICDTEPYDVTHYARASATFPQESTADQWFDESQFESYRALGKTAVTAMGGAGPLTSLDEFETRVAKYISGGKD